MINDKLAVVGNLIEGYYIYYLVFAADMKSCTLYKYSKTKYTTESAANVALRSARLTAAA